MISWRYFYHMENDSQFICGIITVKSWLPDPVKAFESAYVRFTKETGSPKYECKIMQFNRI